MYSHACRQVCKHVHVHDLCLDMCLDMCFDTCMAMHTCHQDPVLHALGLPKKRLFVVCQHTLWTCNDVLGCRQNFGTDISSRIPQRVEVPHSSVTAHGSCQMHCCM